jgi:micrococcal nuclease
MRKIWKIIVILIFVLFLLLFRFAPEIGIDVAPYERFKVVGIIDGDTFELAGGDKLRLLSIDCPEKGDPYSTEATALAEKLVLGKTAEVAFANRRRDGYGRMLGYLYVDSQSVNAELVRNGLAYVYLFEDNLADTARIMELLAAQNEAIDNRLGLWSRNNIDEPYYLAGGEAYRFHRPGCSSVPKFSPDKYIRFGSRLEAFRRGYSPCRNCKP